MTGARILDDATKQPRASLTAGFDPLRDEGGAYARRLAEAGVAVEEVCFEGNIHGFLSFSGDLAAGRAGFDRITRSVGAKLSEA